MEEKLQETLQQSIETVSAPQPEVLRLRKQNKLLRLICGLLAFCLLLSLGITAWTVTQRRKPTGSAEPNREGQIRIGDTWLDILEGLKPSSLKAEQFVLGADGRISYSGEPRPLFGIDVSHHQGRINWSAVAADGVEFALIRMGYRGYSQGGIMTDKSFAYNLEQAQSSGIAVGLYFFSQAVTVEEAQEEARYLLAGLGDTQIAGPIVFDWEEIAGTDARTDYVKRETLTDMAAAFCAEIESAGHKAMVYFNQETGYFHYDLSRLEQYGFWLAEYKSHPSFYYDFDIWQYSSTGRVAGIEGSVDLNLCFGDYFAAG